MRVAFLHFEYPFGGGEMVTSNLSEYLISKGCKVDVLVCKLNILRDKEITFVNLPYTRRINHNENIDFIIEYINTKNVDILVLPGVYLKRIDLIKQKTSVKVVFNLHSVPMWEAMNKVIVAKEKAKRSLLHGLEWILIQSVKYNLLKTHQKSIRRLYYKTFQMVDAYVVLCSKYKTDIEQVLKLEDSSKLFVIPNSTNPGRCVDFSTKEKEVLYVGRLSYADKRVDRLIDIWADLSIKSDQWKLRIVGDGPELNRLKNLVANYGLSNVLFEGYQSDLQHYYTKASILCLTSTFEGWGLCLTEAQAYGVVPIAFNCSAGVEYILSPNCVNGILVPPFMLDTYAKELAWLMTNDQDRIKIAKAALIKSNEYSPDAVGEKWLKLFKSLISQ
ncbi:MAG: glycosyltransferase [Bacteroidales bacterium]